MPSSDDYHGSSHTPLPLQLYFFLLVLLMFISFSWYMNFESIFGGFFDQIKLVFILSPLILLVVVHCLTNFNAAEGSSFFVPLQERESAGGTPWGIGFLLVLLFFMISYHSSFKERWFPLFSQ